MNGLGATRGDVPCDVCQALLLSLVLPDVLNRGSVEFRIGTVVRNRPDPGYLYVYTPFPDRGPEEIHT